jgi:BRCA1-associated protein
VSLPDGVEVDKASSGGVGLRTGAAGASAAEGGGGSGSDSNVSPWEVVEFSAGNPRAEIISGKMHLYRDVATTSSSSLCLLTASSAAAAASPATAAACTPAAGELLPEGRNAMVCVLAVPSSLSVADFCQFAAALISKVVEMRMVKSVDTTTTTTSAAASTAVSASSTRAGGVSGDSGTYSVILRFEDQDAADSFALNYHNRRFNSFVEGTCRVLFVRSIELTPAAGRGGASSSRYSTILSGGGGEASAATDGTDAKDGAPNNGDAAKDASAVTAAAPPPPVPEGLTELPSCPVCLDRLDQDVSGVVTTICSHSFHASCLSKWGDSSCPVCRYTQQPEDEVGLCCTGWIQFYPWFARRLVWFQPPSH